MRLLLLLRGIWQSRVIIIGSIGPTQLMKEITRGKYHSLRRSSAASPARKLHAAETGTDVIIITIIITVIDSLAADSLNQNNDDLWSCMLDSNRKWISARQYKLINKTRIQVGL